MYSNSTNVALNKRNDDIVLITHFLVFFESLKSDISEMWQTKKKLAKKLKFKDNIQMTMNRIGSANLSEKVFGDNIHL